MNRRKFLKSTGMGAAMVALPWRVDAKYERPNIVFVFSDQQHWRAMGCMDPFFDTPVQDALAEDAMLFERNFCTTPQCSPSRSSILTGWYPSKTGVMGNLNALGGDSLDQQTVGDFLQGAGYHTGYFGKWHLGDRPAASGGWSEMVRKRRDAETTENALKFIEKLPVDDKPFALFVSYVDPHDIYKFRRHTFDETSDVPLPESWRKAGFDDKPPVHLQFMTDDQGTAIHGKDKVEWKRYRDCYRAKNKIYDTELGRVLDAVKAKGNWEDTVVIVTSDHGDMDAHHKLIYKGPFMYDQMIRVPLIVRVPKRFGGVPARRITDFDVVNVDLFPTILDLCGIENEPRDGLSLAPTLTGEPRQNRRSYVVCQYYSKQKWVNPIRTIRTAEFKYNRYMPEGEELYDLKNDPNEIDNMAAGPRFADVKKELATKLDRWIIENNDPFYSLKATTRDGTPRNA